MQQYLDRLRERYVDQTVKWGTIAGLVLVVLGSLGPWATVGVVGLRVSANGFGYNGGFVFALAIAGLVAIGAFAFTQAAIPRATLLWGLVVGAAVIDLFVALSLIDILTTRFVSVGWGLWACVLGAAACTAGAMVPMWADIQAKAGGLRGGAGPRS